MKTPTICPLCNNKMMYSSGDCMWDNTYSCANKKHKNYHFTCEANTVSYIEIYEVDSKISLRLTIEKYGDIPPNTLTIGKDFSPYNNERINWNYKSPLVDKFKEIIKKLEMREIFS